MHQLSSADRPLLVRQPHACRLLGITRSGLERLRKKDPSFPRPIKDGDTRQAACFYVAAEIEEWVERKKAERGATA